MIGWLRSDKLERMHAVTWLLSSPLLQFAANIASHRHLAWGTTRFLEPCLQVGDEEVVKVRLADLHSEPASLERGLPAPITPAELLQSKCTCFIHAFRNDLRHMHHTARVSKADTAFL